MSEVSFCHNCGSKQELDNTFCSQCGVKLSQSSTNHTTIIPKSNTNQTTITPESNINKKISFNKIIVVAVAIFLLGAVLHVFGFGGNSSISNNVQRQSNFNSNTVNSQRQTQTWQQNMENSYRQAQSQQVLKKPDSWYNGFSFGPREEP